MSKRARSRALAGEFRWLVASLRPYWTRHVGAVATAAVSSAMVLIDPLVLGWIIDEFIKSPSASVPLIGAALSVGAFEARLCLSAVSVKWAAETYQRLVLDLRVRLLDHFDRLSLDYHETTAVGAKHFILVDCVDAIAVIGAEAIPRLITSFISGLAVIVMIVVISPKLALALLPWPALYLLVTRYFRRQIRDTTEAANVALDRMCQCTYEHLSAVPQIQMLSHEGHAIKKAREVLARVKDCQGRRINSEIGYTLANGTITALAAGVALGYGGYLVTAGAITIGKLVVCYSYLARLSEPINGIADAHAKFQKSVSSIRRLQEFLSLVPSVAAPALPAPVHRPDRLQIECRRISFAYRDRRAISDLTFELSAGERISIAGRSGAGKSTAAKVLARLYDPQSGSVNLNGEDFRSIDLKQLRRLIHYMPQQAVLFTGTVEDNLRYGDPGATDADVQRAVDLAYLEPVIRRMPRGLSEMLGPSGCHLSGGERQRLALGRAILQQPRVLILDEATAFLDAMVEQTIFDNLKTYLPETTLVLISHRLSALTWVDRHLLLDRGVLVASGSHARLYDESPLYRDLYQPTRDVKEPAAVSLSV